jgi:hypothetical protein
MAFVTTFPLPVPLGALLAVELFPATRTLDPKKLVAFMLLAAPIKVPAFALVAKAAQLVTALCALAVPVLFAAKAGGAYLLPPPKPAFFMFTCVLIFVAVVPHTK